jgi:hypothetical protein
MPMCHLAEMSARGGGDRLGRSPRTGSPAGRVGRRGEESVGVCLGGKIHSGMKDDDFKLSRAESHLREEALHLTAATRR